MNLKFVFFTLFVTFISSASYAQGYSHRVYNDLDDATCQKISKRATQEVNQFTDLLALMVTKPENPYDVNELKEWENKRIDWKRSALDLFVGRGEEYYTYIFDDYGYPCDTIMHNPVNMQVTSLRNKKPRNLFLKDYLTNLIDQANKRNSIKVTIQTTKWQSMKTSEIRKLEDGHYELNVYFEQVYIRDIGGDHLIYADRTTKRVTCYIEIIETDFGTEFIVRLGDIEATDTQEYEA